MSTATATAATAITTKLRLYGVPLSQPFRAVAWTLLQRHVPFEVVVTAPGMEASKPYSTRHASFISKTKGKTNTIPMLEEITTTTNSGKSTTTSFCISESPAMLMYLCETPNWVGQSDLYDVPGSKRKVLVDSYMHWHHNGTRNLLSLTVPYLRPDISVTEQQVQQANETLVTLEQGWLSGGPSSSSDDTNDNNDIMIGGGTVPSIADILCYEEIVQATMTGLLSIEPYPRVQTWLQHMEALPYHAQAHAALTSLESLVQADGITPVHEPAAMRKLLAAATKAGLGAYQSAQASYK